MVSVLKWYCYVDWGVCIKIRKVILVVVGLGGGLFDVVVVLWGLNWMWNFYLDLVMLVCLGL